MSERRSPLSRWVARLPPRWQWAPHNLVAHPLSEILFHLGFEAAGNWLHDETIPPHKAGEGRG